MNEALTGQLLRRNWGRHRPIVLQGGGDKQLVFIPEASCIGLEEVGLI